MTIIQDFRLVSVSPHPQLFEPSPMDELRMNLDVHDVGNDAQRQFNPAVGSGVPGVVVLGRHLNDHGDCHAKPYQAKCN